MAQEGCTDPSRLFSSLPKSASGTDRQTAFKHPLIRENPEQHLLVWDVFAAIDKGEDDIAQRWQGEAEAGAPLAVLAEHFHAAAQVNKVQAAATSRHCHKQSKQTVSVGLQKQLPRKAKVSLTLTTQEPSLIPLSRPGCRHPANALSAFMAVHCCLLRTCLKIAEYSLLQA